MSEFLQKIRAGLVLTSISMHAALVASRGSDMFRPVVNPPNSERTERPALQLTLPEMVRTGEERGLTSAA